MKRRGTTLTIKATEKEKETIILGRLVKTSQVLLEGYRSTQTHYHSREPKKCSRELKYANSMIQHCSNETVTQVPRVQAAFLAVTGCGSKLNIHDRSGRKKKLYAHLSEKLNCGHKQQVN